MMVFMTRQLTLQMKEVDYVSLHSKKVFKSVPYNVIVAKEVYLKYCACLGLYSTTNNFT